MAIALDAPGIQSIDTALVESFDVEKSVQVTDPVLTSAGRFHKADAFNPTFKGGVKGRGDIPAAFALGSDGDSLAVDGITGGKTIITDIEESEKNDDNNSWSMDFMNYPGAS